MSSHKKLEAQLAQYEEQRRKLTAQLSVVGFVWHGSVYRSLLTCGKATCRCHEDPKARHGPYAYWTTKVRGKTVSRLLSLVEAQLYEEWIENRRQIDRIVQDLKALSVKAARVVLKLRLPEARSKGMARS
jgi:hypothetical protein